MFSIHDEYHIGELLEKNKQKKFRYAQIENALYKNLITDFEHIEILPKEIRKLLKENCFYNSLTIHSTTTSDDGQTTKFLLKTHDGKMIEAVIMRHLSGRNTLCVSCQAGCPMACAFCATGKLGLIRNLEFYEIIDQIMIAILHLKKEGEEYRKTLSDTTVKDSGSSKEISQHYQKKEDSIVGNGELPSEEKNFQLRNIVYMGMGEPMMNYDNVARSIAIACGQKKLDFSNRRITLSTCGIIPGILRIAEDFPQISLAVSLHAPNDEARKRIMPIESTYPIAELMQALDIYVQKTNKRVFYEYIMIAGVTDCPEYAHELAKLLQGRLAHVNFIPYNPGEGIMGDGFQPTQKIMIKKFQDTLEKVGVPSTIRHTMGDDIDAACGQLALREEGKSFATEQGKSLKKIVEKHWNKS